VQVARDLRYLGGYRFYFLLVRRKSHWEERAYNTMHVHQISRCKLVIIKGKNNTRFILIKFVLMKFILVKATLSSQWFFFPVFFQIQSFALFLICMLNKIYCFSLCVWLVLEWFQIQSFALFLICMLNKIYCFSLCVVWLVLEWFLQHSCLKWTRCWSSTGCTFGCVCRCSDCHYWEHLSRSCDYTNSQYIGIRL